MTVRKLDARYYKSGNENRIIFETLDSLQLGESIEVIDDHDPGSLYNLLQQERPNEYEWDYIQDSPGVYKISIEKKYQSFI